MSEVRLGRSFPLPPGMRGAAIFSPDGRFRYVLSRTWAWPQKPVLIACGTNPSSAGRDRDDSTIRILEGLAARQGFGRLIMLNAYALCSTERAAVSMDPAAAIGPDNDYWIKRTLQDTRPGDVFLAAWGRIDGPRHEWLLHQMRAVQDQLPARCLGILPRGFPHHPLRCQTRRLLAYYS
jgi:hypothetical protein